MMLNCKTVITLMNFIIMTRCSHPNKQSEKVLQELVSPGETLAFVTKKGIENCDARILSNSPRFVVDSSKPSKRLKQILTFLLCIDNSKILKSTLRNLVKSPFWHNSYGRSSKHILVSNTTDTEGLSNIFWKHKIFDVTLLQKTSTFNRSKRFSRFSQIYQRLVPIETYTIKKNIVEIPKPDRIILKTQNLINTTSEMYFKGMVGTIYENLKVLGKSLDLDVICDYKCDMNSDEYICLYQDLYSYMFLRNKFDTTEPFFMDTLSWMIPRTKDVGVQSMIFVFSWKAGAVFVIIFVFLVAFCRVLAKILNNNRALHRTGRWILMMVKFLLGLSTSVTPRTISLRLLLVVYLYYGFVISNLYQGHMTDVLTDPPDIPELHNTDEVAQSNIPLLATPNHLARLKKGDLGNYEKLKNQLVLMNLRPKHVRYDYCIKNGCGMISAKYSTEYFQPHYFSKFYPVENSGLGESTRALYVRQEHYIFKKLKFFQRVVHESGLYQKIRSDLKRKWIKPPKETEEVNYDHIYLRFVHLKEIFFLLLVGLGTATLALIGELLYYYCYETRNARTRRVKTK